MVDDRPVNGAAHMIDFNDSIYAGSWDGYIWSSTNGITWTEIITDGFNGTHQGIARFAVFSDTLYASTWYSGTDIWRTSDGISWERFVEGGLGDINNSGAIASEIFNGNLYWGLDNWTTGAQLWRTDGITTTAVITDGFGTIENGVVSSLAVFVDDLYAGICNYNQGVQVLRSNNGLDWENVTDGFAHPETGCINSLEVYKDKLYLVIQNDELGVEVWRTTSGTEWEQVGFDGFGNPVNTETYWDNATQVFKNTLYIGVKNWPTGGEVWQMTDLQDTIFLPCIYKPCASFFDNFSNPSSGWPIEDSGDTLFEYKDGEYRILVRSTYWGTGVYPGFQASDYNVTVTLRNPNNVWGSYGIGFGIAGDWSSAYTFEIDPDGWFGIYRVDPSDYETLAEAFSPAINQGSAANQLKIVRDGASIDAYANGQLLASVIDGTYTGLLNIGIVASSYEEENLDIRYDNFEIVQLRCNGTKSTENLSLNWSPSMSVLPHEFNRLEINRHQP